MRKTILLFASVLMILSVSVISPAIAASSYSLPANSARVPDSALVAAAKAEFMALSKKEKKAKVKEVKKELKKFKNAKKSGAEPSESTLLLVILAILLPPLAVYLYEGEINTRFWISLLLTLLFWLPGIIYALILILGEM